MVISDVNPIQTQRVEVDELELGQPFDELKGHLNSIQVQALVKAVQSARIQLRQVRVGGGAQHPRRHGTERGRDHFTVDEAQREAAGRACSQERRDEPLDVAEPQAGKLLQHELLKVGPSQQQGQRAAQHLAGRRRVAVDGVQRDLLQCHLVRQHRGERRAQAAGVVVDAKSDGFRPWRVRLLLDGEPDQARVAGRRGEEVKRTRQHAGLGVPELKPLEHRLGVGDDCGDGDQHNEPLTATRREPERADIA